MEEPAGLICARAIAAVGRPDVAGRCVQLFPRSRIRRGAALGCDEASRSNLAQRCAESVGRHVRGAGVVSFHRAFHAGDGAAAADWNDRLLSSRETRELRAETAQMGHSLRRLMEDSGEFEGTPDRALQPMREVAFATAFAPRARHGRSASARGSPLLMGMAGEPGGGRDEDRSARAARRAATACGAPAAAGGEAQRAIAQDDED